MALSFQFPTQGNGYLPKIQSELQTDYSLSASAFPINRYCKFVKVDQTNFGAPFFDPSEAPRISDNNDWAFGTKPSVNFDQGVTIVTYNSTRKNAGAIVDDTEVRNVQGLYDAIAMRGKGIAHRLMTIRTQRLHTVLGNSANWGGNTATVSTACGTTAHWDDSDATKGYIQTSLQYAAAKIALSTGGVVTMPQLVCVVNPNTAGKLKASPEIKDILKQSPVAQSYLDNSDWGLPVIWGIKFIVDATVKNTALSGLTPSLSFVVDDDSAMLLHRPGQTPGDVAFDATPSMATANFGIFDDLGLDVRHDDLAHLTEINGYDTGAVVHNYLSGYLLTDIKA